MGTLAFVFITATPAFVVYISAAYFLGSPLLAIIPAGITWWLAYWGYEAIKGDI